MSYQPNDLPYLPLGPIAQGELIAICREHGWTPFPEGQNGGWITEDDRHVNSHEAMEFGCRILFARNPLAREICEERQRRIFQSSRNWIDRHLED